MNATAIRQRTVPKPKPEKSLAVQVISKNDERLEQVVGEMVDPKTEERNKMAHNSIGRRDEWTQHMLKNPEFVNEYRATGYGTNTDHISLHQYRNAHTSNNELGVTVKTFLTSKERANEGEMYYKSIQADATGYNQKRQIRDGNFLRTNKKMDHKQQPLHHKKFDEFSRVTQQIAQQGRDYLPESFNLDICRYPVWHENKKQLWLTEKGFDNYAGVDQAHVKIGHPGAGREEAHIHSLNAKAVWSQCHNVPEPGVNPFTMSYPQMTAKTFQRRRNVEKEISDVPFNSTCRPSLPLDEKVKINSVNIMSNLDKAYLITTQKSPTKIVSSSAKQVTNSAQASKKILKISGSSLSREQPTFLNLSQFDKEGNESLILQSEGGVIVEETLDTGSEDNLVQQHQVSIEQQLQHQIQNSKPLTKLEEKASKVLFDVPRKSDEKPIHIINEVPVSRNTKQREIKTVVQTPKTNDARYRPILTNLNTDTGEKAAIVYENWRNNPNILVQAQPFSANQSFRNTHNHTYRNSIQPVSDTVLANQILTNKTFFVSLKDHIAMIPQNPVYNKERVTSTKSNRLSILPPSTTAESAKNFDFNTPTNKSLPQQNLMSQYNKNSEQTYHYLKRHREDDIVIPTKQLVANFFDNNISQEDSESINMRVEDRLLTAAASRNQQKLAQTQRILPKTSQGQSRLDKMIMTTQIKPNCATSEFNSKSDVTGY